MSNYVKTVIKRDRLAVARLGLAADALTVTGRPREALQTLLISRPVLNDAIRLARKCKANEALQGERP